MGPNFVHHPTTDTAASSHLHASHASGFTALLQRLSMDLAGVGADMIASLPREHALRLPGLQLEAQTERTPTKFLKNLQAWQDEPRQMSAPASFGAASEVALCVPNLQPTTGEIP